MEDNATLSMNRNSKECKKVSILHLVYLSILFIILTIMFWTMTMNTSDEAQKMFSFAATITSIVLAIVSIMFSIVSGFKTYTNLGSMREASESISGVSKDLGHIKDGLNTDIERLGNLETGLQSAQNGILQILQRTDAIWNRINPTEQNTTIAQGTHTDNTEFMFAKTSIVGKCIIYACMLSNEHNKHFPASIAGNPSYVHGYITALETCAPSHFRALGLANGYIEVSFFDKSFFSIITRESIQAEIDSNGLYAEMNTIMKNINSFFEIK